VLRGTATGLVGVDFRRRSCCLLYRLAPAGARSLCGDCVIVPL
jgi:ferric iron reductase protein FhuF